MVDPNRKINRLTEKDIAFLEECEQEFSLRYTEEDAEFMEHCSKPLDDPPIIENWNASSSDFSRNDRAGNRNWRSNSRHKNWGDSYGRKRAFDQRQSSSSGPPMKIRRDYNNFVAASKND